MRKLYQLTINLRLRGPVLVKSTSPASFGLDAAVARDFRTGRPAIPGTLVEGRVRESLEQLGEGDPDGLFGKATGEDTGNDPSRGSLLIGDLVAAGDGARSASLTRVALDSTLGSAKGEMLRVIETPFPAGAEITFSGTAERFCHDAGEAAEIARLLRMGLLWQSQFGALRSTGFGRVLGAEVSSAPVTEREADFSGAPLALDLALAPLGPICVARHKIGDNLFESEDFLPGNVLAGAVMETAAALGIAEGEFRKQFDRIRFRHAFPSPSGKPRPRALPLSTVKAGGIPHDLHDQRDPVLLRDEQGRFVAPEFPVDWKEHGDVLSRLDWACPARQLRVRTAIDRAKRKGAESRLFASEVVHPCDDNGKEVVWRSRIDLSAVDEGSREAVAKTLATALAHLSFVGKTKTRCRVDVAPVEKAGAAPDLAAGQTLALVLQTPALVADPRFQKVEGVPGSGAISADGMLALYRATFSKLSGESLELSHHFAQHRLAGGDYLAHRFQKRKDSGAAYDPWLLTEAGSVFVFTVKDADRAKTKLDEWLATGLPLPEWASQRFGGHWQHNPYLPQNGFGEIAVHQPEFATPVIRTFAQADPILPSVNASAS